MTNSDHDYTAVLIGAPNTPFTITGGEVTLDETSDPHVQGRVDLGSPSEAVLAGLDPRRGARVLLTADAVFPWGTQQRVFNLGVRSRPVEHDQTGRIFITLASDEALADDFRPLADETGMSGMGGSVKSMCNYVLGRAIALRRNLFLNPWPVFGAGNYAPNGELTVTNDGGRPRFTHTVGATPGNDFVTWNLGPLEVGETYGIRLLLGNVAGALAVSASVRDGFTLVPGGALAQSLVGSTLTLSGTFTVTADLANPRVLIDVNGTGTGEAFTLQLGICEPGVTAAGAYFDGGTSPASGTRYEGAANASPSRLSPVVSNATDAALTAPDPAALVWRAGVSAMEFLHPIVQAVGLRLVCDETRTWTLRDENYNAGIETLSIVHGVNLVEGSDTISLDDDSWFDARVTRYTDPDTNDSTVDAYALNTPPRRVTYLEVRSAYPGPGRSQYAVRRAQGRGREVTATTVADWRTKAEQTTQIVLEHAPRLVGETSRVSFDLDTDQMTITTRTVDIPNGAIDLLSGTIDALPGTIDSL